MSHALEHVPDVLATMRALRSRLQPSGWLCLEVPNRNSLRARLSSPLVARLGGDERHRAFPIHLSYFSPLTLRRALQHSGFSIAFATTAGLGLDALLPRRDLSAAISSPRSRSPAATVAAKTRRAAVVSFARTHLKRRYFDALLGENLIVVARLSRVPSVKSV
jgi:Methyltransferase domain